MNMNLIKMSLSGLMALTLSIGAQGATGFSLSGSLQGMPDSVKVVLFNIEDPNGDVKKVAETMASGGSFNLAGDVKSPAMCKLAFQRFSPKRGEYLTVFSTRVMADNAPMTFSTPLSFDSLANVRPIETVVNIKGSKAADEFAEYIAQVSPAERRESDASYLSAQKYFDSNGNEDTVAKYDVFKNQALADLLAEQRRFIAAHPDYNISAYLTQKELEKQFVYTADEINAMADLVKACPDTARTSTVERRRTFAQRYALESPCADFEVTHVDGKVAPFSSLRTPGKYTFIDFWASWCGPCRAAIPHVRELYKKYADKLDIYSISVDETEGPWRKAMEKEQMEWPQLHLSEEQMGPAANAFFLNTIPRLILLDDQGRVVCSTNLPRELSAALTRHLGE